jgi:AraC-like DNA-binding protein
MEAAIMSWYVNYPESEAFFIPMRNTDFSYPAHLHGCLEVSFCLSGEVELNIRGENITLSAGNGALIPPNIIHSYHSPRSSEYCTILFSRNLLPDLSILFSSKRPERYWFPMDESLTAQLINFYSSEQSIWSAKSLLYRTAEAFLRDNSFQLDEDTDPELTMQIATYLQEHLCQEFTLQDLADHLGYSYFYISKRIRQTFHVPFTTLLAQHRVARVKMLLESGNYTVTQAALSSGFGSIRTFNRIFQNLTGMTPSQYLTSVSGKTSVQ